VLLVLLGLSFALGYYIKPTVLIPAIAITLCALPKIPSVFRKKQIKSLLPVIFVLIGFLLGFATVKLSIASLHVSLNKDGEFDLTHYFMMGLNEEHNGVWNPEDVLFSEKIDTLNERHSKDLLRAGERLLDMGPGRTILHAGRKILTSFGDGTFAWAEEGNFFLIHFENTRIGFLYHSFYYPDGTKYHLFLSICQSVWIAVLAFLAIGAFLKKKEEESGNLSFLKLSVFGFMLFELLFEPRARHILPCLPILLILSSYGLFCSTGSVTSFLRSRITVNPRNTRAIKETTHDA
jgi:hypothetical protein